MERGPASDVPGAPKIYAVEREPASDVPGASKIHAVERQQPDLYQIFTFLLRNTDAQADLHGIKVSALVDFNMTI